jgi:CCR4-NOT transcription complex subunit 7/8
MSPIREVWAPNLEVEMRNIRELVEKYPVIAMVRSQSNAYFARPSSCFPPLKDTEFPGVVARPIGSFKTSSDYHYQTMRCNVDLLKPVQVGLTLADEDGNYPQDISTWEFNFHFSVK